MKLEREARLHLRLSPRQHQEIAEVAAAQDLTVSQLVRLALDKEISLHRRRTSSPRRQRAA